MSDPTQGPYFQTATSTSLAPGTNYTVFAAVRAGNGGGSSVQAASPTVMALTGLLVPDTAPPSFTKAVVMPVKAAAPSGSVGNSSTGSAVAGDGTFSITIDLGLNEQGRVYYAVYGNPACISGAFNSAPVPRLPQRYRLAACTVTELVVPMFNRVFSKCSNGCPAWLVWQPGCSIATHHGAVGFDPVVPVVSLFL